MKNETNSENADEAECVVSTRNLRSEYRQIGWGEGLADESMEREIESQTG